MRLHSRLIVLYVAGLNRLCEQPSVDCLIVCLAEVSLCVVDVVKCLIEI